MKHFLTASVMLCSFLAAAQFPNLPYNPDENGDGLIGVVDLQGLLANYGNEFASAVVSEDGESAIVYKGETGYYECKHSCNQLPGFWSLPSGEDLVPVFSELNTNYTYTWLSMTDFIELPYNTAPYYQGASSISNRGVGGTTDVGAIHRCYCTAKQLPRVEYSYCQSANIQVCAAEKVESGWYPIPGASSILNNAPGYSGYYEKTFQAFWRWAE